MAKLVNMDIMKRAQSHENCYPNWYNNSNNEATVQFRPTHQTMESNSPSPSPSPSHPLLLGRSPSSGSRARAIIARGQWELMEMVRNMPESSYELSLKDLVENQEAIGDDRGHGSLEQRAVMMRSKEESKKIVVNNGFENKGLFLNVVFPFSFGSRKKKRNEVGRNFSNNKVSPKVDGGEKDWWKKRFTGSSDSNSSGATTTTTVSSRSGSSSSGRAGRGGRKRNSLPTGCWAFFCSGGRKSVE